MSAIVDMARSCVGTPFVHQGRRQGVGLDCAGLVVVSIRAAGFDVTDVAGYSRLPHRGRLEHVLDGQDKMATVDKSAITFGDILLMRIGREPMHLAVYAGKTIIHAYQVVGKVCEHELDAEWKSRIVKVYRAIM